MTRKAWSYYAKGLKSIYTDPKFMPDQSAVELWFRMLEDLPDEQVSLAIQCYMQTCVFPPTPASIREKAAQIAEPPENQISPEEAFSYVRAAAGNSLYNAETEFERLPPLVKKTIGNPGNLREMGRMDSHDFESVEKSHFIRCYNTELARSRQDQTLALLLRQKIEAMKLDVGQQDRLGMEASGKDE